MTARVRILLVDDRAIIRTGIRAILDQDETIDVVGEAHDAADAERQACRLKPHVLLADAQSPGLDAVALIAALVARCGNDMPDVLLMAAQGTGDTAREALRAGARGVVLSRATPEQLLSAVHMVAAGYAVYTVAGSRPPLGGEEPWSAPACRQGPDAERARADLLTRREREVLRLLAGGLSNAEMSAELVLSESTVKSHVQHLLDKLQLRNRVHAVIYAHRTGLVPGVCACAGPQRSGGR